MSARSNLVSSANRDPARSVSSRWLRWPEATVALGLATLIVFWMPHPALARMLRRQANQSHRTLRTGALCEAQVVGITVRRLAARLPSKPQCLVCSIAVHLMLTRRGVAHVVHFGVRKLQGVLEAHAWVSVEDVAVIGGQEAAIFEPIAHF